MICWRSNRKPIIGLLLLLGIVSLILVPMSSVINNNRQYDTSFMGSILAKDSGDLIAAQAERLEDISGQTKVELPIPSASYTSDKKQKENESIPIFSKHLNHWQTHIKKECEKINIYAPLTENDIDVNLFQHILVDDKHKILYCQIPKVGTMTWRRIFIVSTGKANTTDPGSVRARDVYGKFEDILQYLSDLPKKEIIYRLKHYFKFMFVREPMERLLSAYRNKFLSKVKSSDFFRKEIGLKLAKEYRPLPKTKDVNPEDPNIQFNEFAKYLVDQNRKVPWNEHWDKYNNLCFPCRIPYDFVGKLEQSQKDANFVLKKTGMDKIALWPYRNETNYTTEETKDTMKRYYSTLALSDLRNLVKEYEFDRRLFGYQIPQAIFEIFHKRS